MSSSRLSAAELIQLVLDSDSFESWDEPIPDSNHFSSDYCDELERARTRTGLTESIVTGAGRIGDFKVALIVGEFDFLAGSIGVGAAKRIISAFERATLLGLPVLAAPVSGGTRMQEGTLAFLQMVGITGAVMAHKKAGLPYLVYLRNPTTGGVFASWGSLGHVTVAEPGALIGFLGPRVYEALHGAKFPEGVQQAENLYRHGLLDAVLAPEKLPDIASRALRVLMAPKPKPKYLSENFSATSISNAWDSIVITRKPERPGARSLLRYGASDVVLLHGTSEGESEPGLLLALAKFGDAAAVVLAQDRAERSTALGPGALRQARRGMHLAEELGLPLVTVVDTAGAALSKESEEKGLAGEIARSLADQLLLHSPVICVLLGQGSGGGALALLPADRVVAAEHAWLSPLPPEGAAVIVHRDINRAAEMAEAQGVKAAVLLQNQIVDWVVPENPDAADESADFCRRMANVIESEISKLHETPISDLVRDRMKKYRNLGSHI